MTDVNERASNPTYDDLKYEELLAKTITPRQSIQCQGCGAWRPEQPHEDCCPDEHARREWLRHLPL